MRRVASVLLGPMVWLGLTAIAPEPGMRGDPIDPLTLQDDDFARHRDPATWRGLAVTRIEFREERGAWRLFRIVNVKKPRGPSSMAENAAPGSAASSASSSARRSGVRRLRSGAVMPR